MVIGIATFATKRIVLPNPNHVSLVPELVEGLTAKDAKIYAKFAKRFFVVLSIKTSRRSPLNVSFCPPEPTYGRSLSLSKVQSFNLSIFQSFNLEIFEISEIYGFSVKFISGNFVRGNRSPSHPPPSRRSFEKKSTYHYGFSAYFF